MPLNVTNLAELDEDSVTQSRETVSQLIQENIPTAYVKRGAFHDLVLHGAGILSAARQEEMSRVLRSSSLLEISNDPTLADEEIVDRVMSNYGLTRLDGSKSIGEVKIVISESAPVVIAAGALFIISGQEFVTTAAFAAVSDDSDVLTTTDRLLVEMTDGNFAFTVDVEAVTEGGDHMIAKDTSAEPDFTIVNFVQAYAARDFSEGRNLETNAELLARQQEGIAAKTMSARINMNAALRAQFPDIVGSSIVGFGDAEQIRDQHTALPISIGCRVDWYVRSARVPAAVGLTKTATLIEKTVDNYGIWQFAIDRDEAPGFYNIESIRPLESEVDFGSFEITQELRAQNLTNILGELTPDIASSSESAYSRYQTAIVQFKDTITTTNALTINTSTQTYDVTVRAMPQLDEIQAYAGDRDVRFCGGDILVRAPIPCYLSLSFTIQGTATSIMPDPEDIQQSLANYVNSLHFPGRLAASSLSDIVHNFLSEGVTMSSIDMFGQIRYPSGVVRALRSKEVLIVPNDPANMVSARTVAFILLPENIAISGETLNTPDV